MYTLCRATSVAHFHLTIRKESTLNVRMVQTRRFIYAKRFDGMPKLDDFELEVATLPELKDGDVLVEALYLSVDPYMRKYMDRGPLGVPMIGLQIAKVLDSKHSKFPRDAIVCGPYGWCSHTIFNPDEETAMFPSYVLPSFGNLPLSLGIGHLGMPGNTAYFGFLDVCKPKAGEVVVVSGAAGAVGSIVGQIAKLMGCTVIGVAGSEDKCKWLEEELGFDCAINYKTSDIEAELDRAAPEGVDCYFDNVGGEISAIVISRMREKGRISICGTISTYNRPMKEWPKMPMLQPIFNLKQLKMEGFLVKEYFEDRWFEGISQLQKWIESGQMKYRETVTEGFDNMPQAFIDMLSGKNFGKSVVKA